MSVPWRSALPNELVGEVTARLVEFLRGMLGNEVRMLRNADLHTADQIAVLVRIGHALACDAHFRRWTSRQAL